jgi:hypothetical protein
MSLIVVSPVVWQGKIYIATQARAKSGFLVHIDPVYVVDTDIDSLSQAIRDAFQRGHPLIDDPDLRKQPDILLNATGARNWKTLAKHGASFQVARTDENIRITVDRLDSKGRWEPDPDKERILDIHTPVEVIASIILDSLQTHLDDLKRG